MSGCSMPPLPPRPPVPPPPAPPCSTDYSKKKKKLYQTIGLSRSPIEGDNTEPVMLIRQRESSFSKDLHWILMNTYVPSLVQDGPQCGLVALWMAAHLLQHTVVDMDAVVRTARSRGFTAQGEMFSACNMALLAEEVCGCKAELLSGGLSGNASRIIAHLWARQPVLIPYDEDYNHEPCQRRGHRAHWAVASGVLLGVDQGSVSIEHAQPDPTLPWIHLCGDSSSSSSSSCPAVCSSSLREVYILAKQGKSIRYQMWSLDSVAGSNEQLKTMDPQRSSDGTAYVVPEGGVEVGLAGQAVLLHTRT
ncbi:actin maturation protease [Dunckerocampus dactyliophorus]|uniref:actin maturation protease n=1 Tax=Dunckerocampus dactyliophorus TaxID=161453 RepID=UPI00240715A8|nr:actin maturation protease [Dunckerocampus dactyliophorus]